MVHSIILHAEQRRHTVCEYVRTHTMTKCFTVRIKCRFNKSAVLHNANYTTAEEYSNHLSHSYFTALSQPFHLSAD